MNFKMVFNVVGKMLMLLAALLILPTIVSLIYDEQLRITISFFSTVIVCFLLSVIIHYLTKDVTERDFYKREGYVIVTFYIGRSTTLQRFCIFFYYISNYFFWCDV